MVESSLFIFIVSPGSGMCETFTDSISLILHIQMF